MLLLKNAFFKISIMLLLVLSQYYKGEGSCTHKGWEKLLLSQCYQGEGSCTQKGWEKYGMNLGSSLYSSSSGLSPSFFHSFSVL